MKKLLISLGLTFGFMVAANADNLPAGNYTGTLNEATSSWSWNTNVTGIADNNSKITVAIPSNPHLFNLTGTLTATVLMNGNSCTSSDAQVKVGIIKSNITFSNCSWNGHILTTDYKAAPIFGVVITGHATLSHS